MLRVFTRARKGRVVGLVALFTVMMAADIALANITPDNMFPATGSGQCKKNGVCQTDNVGMTVFIKSNLSQSGRAAIKATLDGSYATTDLNVTYESSADTTGGTETDTIYEIAPKKVDAGDTGKAWCDDPLEGSVLAPNPKCDQFYAAFKVQPDRGLACHETGHTVGLLHGAASNPPQPNEAAFLKCMRKSASVALLGSHNAAIIDETYP